MKIPRVAILTTLMDLPEQYGLVPVIMNQLKMFIEHDYPITLFAQEGFEKHPDMAKLPPNVEVKAVVPFMHLYDYELGGDIQKHPVDYKGEHDAEGNKTNYYKQVAHLVEVLGPELAEYDIVITHDIIFQTWFIVHNAAIREIQELYPDIKWIHWFHSGPSPRPKDPKLPHIFRYCEFPNSIYVSPNESMIPKFAEMYNSSVRDWKTVYHSFDPIGFFDMHSASERLINKHDLLDTEVLCVWPTRIDHPEGKGIYKGLNLISQMYKIADVKLLFLNSWSDSKAADHSVKHLREYAEKKGLPKKNLIFSSEMGKEWRNGVPKKVVRDMFLIGNLFIQPSQSETFSMVMVEAAACKNLLVLNEDLTVMKELGGSDTMYAPFGSEWGGVKITRNFQPDEDTHYRRVAGEILESLRKHYSLQQHRKVLTTFNNKWIWKHQVFPLLRNEE